MNVTDVRWIDIPFSKDDRGELTVVEASTVSFPIKRIFCRDRVPPGVERGGHAHPLSSQVVIPVAGRLRLKISDGHRWESVDLDDPNRGLFLPPMTWTELLDFADGCVALVVCNTEYVP